MPASDRDTATSLVSTLGELIAIPSTYPPGDSRALAAYVERRLGRGGYKTDVVRRRQGVDNVVARLGTGRPSVAFNVHVDTVGPGERAAWHSDPFAAAVKDGRVYGLGACNNKGTAAVHLWLAEAIARRGGPKSGE